MIKKSKMNVVGKGKNLLLCFILFSTSFSCRFNDNTKEIFNAKELIRKSPEAFIELFGKPDSVYEKKILSKTYYVHFYKDNETEVRFFDQKSVEIILNDPENISFEPQSITRFGFDYSAPSQFDENAMITWKNFYGFKVISFYLVGTRKTDPEKVNFKIYFNMKEE